MPLARQSTILHRLGVDEQMIDLDAIEARAVKAEYPTNGNACTPALGTTNKYEISRSESPSDPFKKVIGTTPSFETGIFWVWAKHDVLALIARVRELEAVIAQGKS
jgi:hypothetical protein